MKACIMCGAGMPKRPSSKGWRICRHSSPGMGARWYRSCGCTPYRAFDETIKWLFHEGLDYPPHAHWRGQLPLFADAGVYRSRRLEDEAT